MTTRRQQPCLAIVRHLVLLGLAAATPLAVAGCEGEGDAGAAEDDGVAQDGLAAGEVTIFTAADTPAVVADADARPVEVGVRFRADVAGEVTGVRFYKARTNRGTHVGHLWTNAGALLGAVTFTSEKRSGWQTARFASPIAVQPGVTYVASYHTDSGHYSATSGAFAGAGVDRAPLHALRDGADGANGVFAYGAGAFPDATFAATNYFVDVVFLPGASGTDAGAPPPASDAGTTTSDAGTDSGSSADSGALPPPPACTRTADTGTFAAQFAAATTGDTICLASGDYGTFRGAAKPGLVTITAAAGATVTMAIAYDGVSNVRVDGVTVRDLDMTRTHDVTISHVRFTGQAVVHAGVIANANIVFDGNTHVDTPNCTACFQGRLHVDAVGSADTGVFVRHSLFKGGQLDGVRADANGVVIEDNEFCNLVDMDPYHTDPIQIYGGRRITIRRNFFHDNAVAAEIGGWDGNDHNVVEDNVFVGSPNSGEAIGMLSDVGSIIRHNTLVQGQCAYGWKCGIVDIAHKTSDPPSTGTVVRDNILSQITSTDATGITADHNLFTGTQTPTYVGPTTAYAGYRLAPGSPGTGAASDGTNVGIR